MRPSLIPIAIAACFASPLICAQHPASNVATPATALAARPVGNVASGTTIRRSQSAFGQAMAELTRSARESKRAKDDDGADRRDPVDRRGYDASAATDPSDPDGNAVVAASDPNDL